MIDVLLPGERETLRGPATDLAEELTRLEVLSDDASLSDIGGVDLVVEEPVGRGRAERTSTTSSTSTSRPPSAARSTARRCRSATGSARTSTRTCPSSTPRARRPTPDTLPLTAVRKDGRWYLSLFYTAAEAARAETGEDIPAEGIAPTGGDSPEEAMDAFLDGVEGLDLERRHRLAQPRRVRGAAALRPAVRRRRPGRRSTRSTRHDVDLRPGYEVTGSGDTRSVTVAAITFDVSAEGESVSMELRDGCWIVTSSSGETT